MCMDSNSRLVLVNVKSSNKHNHFKEQDNKNGKSLVIRDAYSLKDYQIKIIYNHTLLSAKESPLFGYDNFPHHPHLSSSPHHKHVYPKNTHKSINFSGNIPDVLHEIHRGFNHL